MASLSAYLRTWRLKLSHAKTVTAAFLLHNGEPDVSLKSTLMVNFCHFSSFKLPWGKTGPITMFHHHLETLRKKLSNHVTLLRRLAGSEWGAGAKTLRIAALFLVYATAEYCTPVCCRSTHTRVIDSVLNDALHIVTGCLRPTPTDHLPILSGIQMAELRRLGATFSLAKCGTLNPDHTLHSQLAGSPDVPQE